MTAIFLLLAFMAAIAIPTMFTGRYWKDMQEDGYFIFIVFVMLVVAFTGKDFWDFIFKEYFAYTGLVILYGLVEELNL